MGPIAGRWSAVRFGGGRKILVSLPATAGIFWLSLFLVRNPVLSGQEA